MIVQDTLIFRAELMKHAQAGDLFELERLSARLVFNTATRIILWVARRSTSFVYIDVIHRADKIIRGVDCNAIRQDTKFMTVFYRQAQLLPVEFWARYFPHPNPLVHFRRWQNRRTLDALIGDMIDERAKSIQGETSQKTGKKPSVVVDYALETGMEQSKSSRGVHKVPRMDGKMRDDLISQ